jgi:hypothetical protein
VILSGICHWKFFWFQKAWFEARQKNHEARSESILPSVPAGVSAQKPARTRQILILIGVIAFFIIALSAFVFFLKSIKSAVPTAAKEKKSQAVGVVAVEERSFYLEGTSVDSQGSYAIVNGEVLKTGDMVKGYRIEAIRSRSVELSKEGNHYQLDEQGNLKQTNQPASAQTSVLPA